MYRIIRYAHPRTARSFPAFAARSPWSGLESEIDHLFSTALADFAAPAAPRFPVDFHEDKDSFYVRAELPGVSREAINLEVVDGYLTITATRKDGEEASSRTRTVALPAKVQADKISASLENGVLTVTLPKQEQVKPRQIVIN
ncbi:MAG: Hsp20/alpha crystallin family protein [Opitutae bacterium]|nr:Hsp20/alpha crystallin family protein [Opitutae bacterium]